MENKTFALIRMSGMIKVKQEFEETLYRLGLRRKYACVIVHESPEIMGMIQKIRNLIAFGEIDEKTLVEIVKARGKVFGKKNEKVKDAEKIAKEMMAGKNAKELGMKPWFGLHPARGGINTKKHYPKGVIGGHGKEISKLIMKML